jgi:hypothetical protein
MAVKLKLQSKFVERRRHARVDVKLLGRYMLADRREFPCLTANMSPGGLAIEAPVRGNIGERVVVYLDQLGRVEGRIIRHTERGFAIQMTMPLSKREKIANQLTWLLNRETLGAAENRTYERIVPLRPHAILQIDGDNEHIVQLIDISVSGAAIATLLKPPLGTKLKIGQMSGEVVRHFEGGLAVRFDQLIPADRFDENIKL